MGVSTNGTRKIRACASGFTLVELLVVMGIITALIGILMPALSAARGQSRSLKCLSNIRQLGEALSMYASDSNGKYPLNTTTPSPGKSWYDAARIGMYLPVPAQATSSSVYSCPEDDGYLSYAMNFWASSAVDPLTLKQALSEPGATQSTFWSSTVSDSPQMILLIESWSPNTVSGGWSAPASVGLRGAAEGQRFGAGNGVGNYHDGRIGTVDCEIPYMRHRSLSGPGTGTQARGRTTIAFADGHAEICTSDSLANYSTGLSNGYAYWYQGDPP
jgi:prepilin-type N-terminal cleavage/methylation domain-containing protein/prepilin-type processing-associated H-X9-DG protein